MAVPEQQMQHSLRIGDVILLYSKEGRGYIFSETSSSANLTLSVLQEPLISRSNPDIPDIRMTAFKVLAPNKSLAQERLGTLKKKQMQNRDETVSMEIAEKNAKSELRNNELEQERQKGAIVLYGSVVQLQHISSKKYVAINTVKTSMTETTNLQMYLLDHDSKNCLFKILPRYKVRSVGDEVRMEDQVMFASEKTEGQYIHTSSRTYGHVGVTLHENNYEINASATESGYTVKSHYRAMSKEQKFVKGGSIIRLFHCELESYLVAEGSFANDKVVNNSSKILHEEVVVEKVHLRKRKSEHGKLKPPSTSSITYWQIEKDEDSLSGQVISWKERCRIKHLPTRLYLAVVKGKSGTYKVKLKKRDVNSAKPDLDIVFRLFPVIEEDNEVQLNSYARISHPHTKTWLVAQKGEPYKRKAFKPEASGLASLQWDSAELLQVSVSDRLSYDDAFTIEEIDEELISKFTYVAGIVPVIKAYVKELYSNHEKISVKRVDAIRKVLKELTDFVKHFYPRMKDHQKLLRNLMVLEMVMSILEKFDPKADHARIHRPVCQACYDLIEVYLLGQSRKNENYLGRFISFFEGQVGMDLNAEQMLTELVRDNALIISKFGSKELDNIIDRLVKTKSNKPDPRFFYYLGVLCVCKNRPIPENQNSIIDKLVKQHGKDLFYLTEVRNVVPNGTSSNDCLKKTKEIYYCVPNNSIDEWLPLSKIASKKPQEKYKYQYQYLLAQLDLFRKLCKGNNESAVHTIDVEFNYLTFEEALAGAKDSDLHPELRSKYVELIVVLYVDVGTNRAILDNLPLSFVYSEISKDPSGGSGNEQTKALTGAVNEHFPALKEWLHCHVTITKSVVACETMIDENNLNAEVLDLLYLLVKYGYYDDIKDINELIPSLVSLLDGKNDKLFPEANSKESDLFRRERRYKDSPVNRPVFNMKIKALKIIDLFFNYRFYIRLQHFIYDYKLLRDPTETPMHSTELAMDLPSLGNLSCRFDVITDAQSEQPPEQLKHLERDSHQLEIYKHKELMDLALNRLEQIFKPSAYKCDYVEALKGGTNFPNILIDLSQYQNDEILHKSLHLLRKFFSAEENLFEKAIQTQLLITSESEKVCVQVLSKLPTLRHYVELDMSDEQYSEIVEILDQFTRLCHLEEDENQPHKQNQKILYNTGVFSDILNLIFRDKSCSHITSEGVIIVGNIDPESAEMKQREHILAKCLQFLRSLARDNFSVQERLFDRMDDLLQLDVAIPEMADVLTEVFTGGQEICLKIKEQQVEKVFNLIACNRGQGITELFEMLQAVVKVEKLDLPLKRNQAYVIKYFSKTRDKFCKNFLGLEEDKVKKRNDLLVYAESSDAELLMLLKVIDLLASCAEGENLFIESICQNVIGIPELLWILSMQDLDPNCKKPFVRFLLWVYMNTGGEKVQTGSTMLFHDWQMWCYLEHTSLILEGVVKALNNLPPSEIQSAKVSLTAKSVRMSQNKRGISKRPKTMSTARNILYVTGTDGELIPGLLLYLMDGVMPMLKIYYAEYFEPQDTSANTAGDSSKIASPDKEIQVSAAIGSSLMKFSSYVLLQRNQKLDELEKLYNRFREDVLNTQAWMYLADVIKNLLTSKAQWDLLCSTMITIIEKPCFDTCPIKIDPKIKQKFYDNVENDFTVPNEALKKYEATYRDEILLNDAFNRFVRNYELAYWGPNTASHQIGSPLDTDYSEFEDEFLDEKGDEWLPLGKSFQNHVKLYMSGHFPNVTIEGYTKRIIDCLESSYNDLADLDEKERQKQDRNDIRYLQLLRALIHNQVKFVDVTLKEEGQNPARYRMQCDGVTLVQNQIQNLGNTVKRIVKLLTHPNDKISAEVLAFVSMLLYNGNETVQKGFSYLMDTREEKLFISMQQRLQQAALNDRERRMLLAQHESCMSSQKNQKDAYVTQSTPREYTRPTTKVLFSPVSGIDENWIEIAFSTESLDMHQLVPSDEGIEMGTIKEGEYELDRRCSSSNSVNRTRTRTWKKKRPSRLNETELLKEAGHAEDEIYLQKIQEEYNKREAKKKSTADDGEKACSLQFKDTSYIDLALRVLSSMCDGQYRPMQNYLRKQPENIKTINLVSEICIFLSSFYVDVTKDNIVLINSVLRTLIEMSVGNFANQEVLFDHQIIDTINCILQITVVMRCDLKKVFELKQSAVELLEVMCEETHSGTTKLVQSIYKVVDIQALHKTLAYFYKLSQDPEMKKLKKDDDAERATFRTYHILVHMGDFDEIELSDLEPKGNGSKNTQEAKSYEDLAKDAWDYCSKSSKSIEVLYKNEDEDKKVLAKVHFRSCPSDELPEELIEKVKYKVNRDSPEDKARDYLDWMKAVKKEMFHLNMLRQHWLTNAFVYNIKMRNYFLIFWTLLMNILLIIAWSDVDLKFDSVYNSPANEMASSSCMENFCSSNMANVSGCNRSYCENEIIVPSVPDFGNCHWFFDYFLYIGGTIHLTISLAMAISYFLIHAANFVLPDFVYEHILKKEEHKSAYSDEPFFGIRALYHIMFVTCSILSLPFYGYFYCICLLHIVIDNDLLQRVLKSVTKNGRSLLWVAALGLVVLYIYSVGTFAFLRQEFNEPNPEQPTENVRFCKSLGQCFISVLEYGLLDTLGSTVGLPSNFHDAALRAVFFDLTFFIIVTTIGLNIVFGIIVDTFSELRDEKWRIDEDKKEKCFICSLPSYEFQRRATGFDHHVKNEHCMWDYIYFYIHLERIDINDHNAIESYVYKQIEADKTDFFPLFHARSLKPKSDEILAELNDLKEVVAEIMKHFQHEEKAASLRRKQEEQAQWEKDHTTEDQ